MSERKLTKAQRRTVVQIAVMLPTNLRVAKRMLDAAHEQIEKVPGQHT
jgi:hypothetical protein